MTTTGGRDWQIDKRAHVTIIWLLIAFVAAIYVFVGVRVLHVDLYPSTKALLLIFMILPTPLGLVLVRAFTQMMEDERVKDLTDAWGECERGYIASQDYETAKEQIKTLGNSTPEQRRDIIYRCMRSYVFRRHPALAELYVRIREARAGGSGGHVDHVMTIARDLARQEMRMAGLHRAAYDLPILFFSFAYLAGLSLVLPLMEQYGSPTPPAPLDLKLPLAPTTTVTIPLVVMQVGFVGGAAYAAFNVVSRFLSRDITPRLFLVSGVRLVLAPLGAVVVYLGWESLSFGQTMAVAGSGAMASNGAVLTYFVAGGFPFSLLRTASEAVLSRLEAWKSRLMAGKRSTTLVEGINVMTAQRLSEEGVDVIQHLAFCDVTDLARRTRYPEDTVADWKDQAILYLLTGDCVVPGAPADEAGKPPTLYDLLDLKAGIRTVSALIRRVWTFTASEPGVENERRGALLIRPDIEMFLSELGLLDGVADEKRKTRAAEMEFLFNRLCEDAVAIEPGLRRTRQR